MADSGIVFRQSLYIGKPAAEVWDAITQKAMVDTYYLAPLGTDIDAVGQEIFYGVGDQKFIHGQVTAFESGKLLKHSFRFDHEAVEAETQVTYEIEAIGEVSALHLTHEGFGAETQTYHDISGGWPVILSNLKTILETGKPLPWPKQE